MKKVINISEEIKRETDQVNELIKFYQNDYDFSTIIYNDWTAKDVLGHITSWHESFAKNISDIAGNIKPSPCRGSLTEVNENGVISMKGYPIEQLIKKLRKAQKTILKHIEDPSISEIPYKRGSRNYSRKEHLEVVERHIKSHLKDLHTIYKA